MGPLSLNPVFTGVTGVVMDCPAVVGLAAFLLSLSDDRGGGGRCDMAPVRVRLINEVIDYHHDNDGNGNIDESTRGIIDFEVGLRPESYPNGTMQGTIGRGGGGGLGDVAASTWWIQWGNVLLFDVTRRMYNGAFLAVPTRFVRGGATPNR